MAATSKDRLLALLASTTLNGIDFVELVAGSPLDLRVHFLNTVAVNATGSVAAITGGERIPTVTANAVATADWGSDSDGRPLLTLHIPAVGDYSTYTLAITSPKLDPYYTQTTFSFEALCPSDFDCAPPAAPCPPPEGDPPPIDYLAKDFQSFTRALSDFSALRYPEWQERSEADFGVMFLEALSGLADDLSYQQDRVAAEATLATATQRRSIVRHARLADYEPRPATIAQTTLMCTVTNGPLPAGVPVSTQTPEGALIVFEIGQGLTDTTSYVVDARWNYPIAPYWWDDSQRCLLPGSTSMFLVGHGFGFAANQALLLDTAAATPADPPLREIVHVTDVQELTDALFGPTPVTRVAWSADEALAFPHDLTRTQVGGNLVPATEGRRYTETFVIDGATASPPSAISRLAANSSVSSPLWDFVYNLRVAPLAWLAAGDPDALATPEIVLTQTNATAGIWNYIGRLIDAGEFESVYTIEAAKFRVVAVFADGTPHLDYDGDRGEVVRFGNGVFGELPNPGNTFEVRYRVGSGAAGNVAAGSLTVVDPAWASLLTAVTNPFAATGGADAETNEQIQRFAPQAFRVRQFRAVRAEDYEAEAERLPWVQQAGTAFRWTGSWLTVFTTVDPKASENLPIEEHTELIELLNRRRLAGYESYVPPAQYVSIDLQILVCVSADMFRGDVERAVLERLGSSQRAREATGFFFADRFTFGTPLERSRLEAAIQSAPGVGGVLSIQYRRRGFVPGFIDLPDVLPLATDQILRVDNDPTFPEHGSIKVVTEGGK